VLRALAALHEQGFVHTGNITSARSQDSVSNDSYAIDIKPDNILVNYSVEDSVEFSKVQLGDCGDAYRFNPTADPFEEGHLIGATIFRSPEAQLNLRWGPATNIWSLRATVSRRLYFHWSSLTR
jgi:hypothetical protein